MARQNENYLHYLYSIQIITIIDSKKLLICSIDRSIFARKTTPEERKYEKVFLSKREIFLTSYETVNSWLSKMKIFQQNFSSNISIDSSYYTFPPKNHKTFV